MCRFFHHRKVIFIAHSLRPLGNVTFIVFLPLRKDNVIILEGALPVLNVIVVWLTEGAGNIVSCIPDRDFREPDRG